MKANEILAIGNEIFSTNERKSIYKKEIFAECKTDKEKKNLRMKLRKKLDAFIAEFIASSKNIEKRKIAEQYYNELWENKLLVYDEYQDTKIYFDTLEIENILYKIIDVLYAQDIKPQRVYKLDDESPRHKIIMGEDIFELRFKEAGKL